MPQPELAGLLPALYPGAFPHLEAYTKPRNDLAAIILTGIPSGIIPGFQNYTGSVQADLLRLNVAVPPTSKPNPLGLVAGDKAGFPNGRRVFDDTTTVELQAIAGPTIPLVDPSYQVDAVAERQRRDEADEPCVQDLVPVHAGARKRVPQHAWHPQGVVRILVGGIECGGPSRCR